MDQYEDIVERACEAIMQRVNDTWPRTLHKDVLRDEIGKAIREARKKFDWQNWPPKVEKYHNPFADDLERARQERIAIAVSRLANIPDPVTASHDEFRKKLSERD